MRVFSTDIKDKKRFTFEGDTLVQKECVDAEKHIYIYERYNSSGRLFGYEVVKGVKTKNPDGNYVYKYPSSEQFGQYGYFIAKKYADTISEYVNKLTAKGKSL